jgi:2-methylaconitate cis-trans-isomerase PrpF
MEVGVDVRLRDGAWTVEKVTTRRTARRLMEGMALIPASVWTPAAQGGAPARSRG